MFKNIRDLLNISGRDMVVFLLSLLLSFSIWLIHNLSQNYSQVVRVPVTAVSKIDGHAEKSSGNEVVQARCRMTGFSHLRLGRLSGGKPLEVFFDPSDLHPGGGDIFYITSSEIASYAQEIFGDEARVEAFVTDTLSFRFPVENHKKVPVQPSVNLSFKSQYTAVGDLQITPDSVTVYGESYMLDGLEKVYTRSLELTDLSASARGEVRLENIRGVRLSDESVSYALEVSRYVEITSEIPVTVRNVPSDRVLIVYPSVAKILFRCTYPVTVKPQDKVSVSIDYRDFSKSVGGKCLPRLDGVPAGVISWSAEPEVFECVESSR